MGLIADTVVPSSETGAQFDPAAMASTVNPDPVLVTRTYRYDRVFFRRVYQLSRPYWTREGCIGSWATLIAMLVAVAGYSICGAWITWLTKDQTNALLSRDGAAFWTFLSILGVLTLLRGCISAVQNILENCLDLHWRQWLGTNLLTRYFHRRTYYKLAVDRTLENVDQRIQEQVQPFCTLMSTLPRQGFGTLVDATVQLTLMRSISMPLFWAALAFVIVKFFALLKIYTPVIGQNYRVNEAEAHFRIGIRHVIDHAETVALYGGEGPEHTIILGHQRNAVYLRLVRALYNGWIDLLQGGFNAIWLVLPLLVLAPSYFDHKIEFGSIAQGAAAVAILLQSLSLFLQFIPTASTTSQDVARVGEVVEAFNLLEATGVSATQPKTLIEFRVGNDIKIDDVSLSTPGNERTLVSGLSLAITRGEHWVISGRTGVGKSSLLRMMAGLWSRGRGTVTVPPAADMMFLPQKPYMMLGTLREQLFYPRPPMDLPDQELERVLGQVCLSQLTALQGGFDVRRDWGRVLSLGEQQRIAIARALIAKPGFLFLDEATSALDHETEQKLYEALSNSETTYVSVGHRPSILRYHQKELRLLDQGQWEIRLIREATPA